MPGTAGKLIIGFSTEDVLGVPNSKLQLYVEGLPVVVEVKVISVFSMVAGCGLALNAAFGESFTVIVMESL